MNLHKLATLASVLVIGTFAASQVFAQTATATPTASSDAKSGSQSNSGAAVISNPTLTATTGGSSSTNDISTKQAQSASSNNHVSTQSAQTTTQSPTLVSGVNVTSNNKSALQAPEVIVSASNTTSPCVIAGGGGASFPGGSIALTGGIKDAGCEMRARTELLKTFDQNVAKAYLCNHDMEIRQAYVDVGQSCYPGRDTALTPRSASVDDSKVVVRGRLDQNGKVEDIAIATKDDQSLAAKKADPTTIAQK